MTMPDGTVITYTNDPLGRRIARAVNGSVKERYLWFGLTTLLAVYDGSGTLYQRFIYADDRMPYAMEMNGSTYYLIYDQVGSLRLVTDSAGNTVKRIDYDTFGNVISDSNESLTVPFGFAGGLHDRDTTLVRFGHRDYMPEIGKWTAKDPILFAGGDTNLYGYVLNDPVNFIDPWGLRLSPTQNMTVTVISSVAAIAGSAIGTPAFGSLTGELAGALSSAFMGGDSTDIINNAFSGALGGYAGGILGNIGKAASAIRPGATALDFFGGMGIDAILYGADPLIDRPCE